MLGKIKGPLRNKKEGGRQGVPAEDGVIPRWSHLQPFPTKRGHGPILRNDTQGTQAMSGSHLSISGTMSWSHFHCTWGHTTAVNVDPDLCLGHEFHPRLPTPPLPTSLLFSLPILISDFPPLLSSSSWFPPLSHRAPNPCLLL